jgi:hypothetical protein
VGAALVPVPACFEYACVFCVLVNSCLQLLVRDMQHYITGSAAKLSEEGLALALRRWVLRYVPWYQ